MERIWKGTLAPAYLHETLGIHQGFWMPQMDRCWMSNDGLQVTSRLLMTKWVIPRKLDTQIYNLEVGVPAFRTADAQSFPKVRIADATSA